MPELLHPHVIVRTQVLFNVSINKTQAMYACAGQRLGCSWGRVTQVEGDALASPDSLKLLKAAEASLLPKKPEEVQD